MKYFVDKTGVPWLKGASLTAAITSVCSMAFLLFGYDQGVMSGVIISKYWLNQMGNPSNVVVATITSVYDLGAMFGALLAALTADQMGRKRALIFGTLLLTIGCILMGAAMEMIMMIFGRIFTGLGRLLNPKTYCSQNVTIRGQPTDLFLRYWVYYLGGSSVSI